MTNKSYILDLKTLHYPNLGRVILQPFIPSWERVEKIVDKILKMTDKQVAVTLKTIEDQFETRHTHFHSTLMKQYHQISTYLFDKNLYKLSQEHKRLIGAYFTKEYCFESVSNSNPSIIIHPNQSGINKEEVRVLFTFRSIGEGHVSSLSFKSGLLKSDYNIKLDSVSPKANLPKRRRNSRYRKDNFKTKLLKENVDHKVIEMICNRLKEDFTFNDLNREMDQIYHLYHDSGFINLELLTKIDGIAKSHCDIMFDPKSDISERVIYPIRDSEINGIEDVRFTHFNESEDNAVYYGTYTSYNGHTISPSLIQTTDFIQFKLQGITGRVAKNKGMTLFPKKIRGKYAMISRVNGIDLFIMFSKNLYEWNDAYPLQLKDFPWRFIQVGTCGPPIETKEGWLLFIHGVGPMRTYRISAILLDKKDPRKIIGTLNHPILEPSESERNGYVPNVVYSCGNLMHKGVIIISYAFSDYASKYAILDGHRILEDMQRK